MRVLKKSAACAVALAMVFAAVGCKNSDSKPDNKVTGSESVASAQTSQSDKSEDLSEQMISFFSSIGESINSGELSGAYEHFSQELKNSMPQELFAQTFEQTVSGLGEVHPWNGSVTLTDGRCELSFRYDVTDLVATLTFDRDNYREIKGIWLNYRYYPHSVDGVFSEKEITVGSGDGSVKGILTLPAQSEGKLPVAILIQGSGQSDMNEQVGQVYPFRDIAQGLASHGVASIRINKRFWEKPELAGNDITIYDETIDDISAAVAEVLSHEELDENKVFLIGHSLGAAEAPLIASRNDRVRGIVFLAGSPRHLADIITDQNRTALKAAGLTDEECNIQMAQVESIADTVKALEKDDGKTYFNAPASYWISLNEMYSGDPLSRLELPMLFLQGEEDFQTDPDKDFQAYKDIMAGRDNCSFISYPGLNHLFAPSDGQHNENEYLSPAAVDGKVIEDIADFILGIS